MTAAPLLRHLTREIGRAVKPDELVLRREIMLEVIAA